MNTTTFKGEGQDLGGKIKETAGDLTGDRSLQGSGIADQLTGKATKVAGSAKDAITPLTDHVTRFAKERPFATAALAGVIGVALLNTLRGK